MAAIDRLAQTSDTDSEHQLAADAELDALRDDPRGKFDRTPLAPSENLPGEIADWITEPMMRETPPHQRPDLYLTPIELKQAIRTTSRSGPQRLVRLVRIMFATSRGRRARSRRAARRATARSSPGSDGDGPGSGSPAFNQFLEVVGAE